MAFSANLFSFFVAYQALTLAAFPLVAHRGDDEARAAARAFLATLLAIFDRSVPAGDDLDLRGCRRAGLPAGGVLAGRVDVLTAPTCCWCCSCSGSRWRRSRRCIAGCRYRRARRIPRWCRCRRWPCCRRAAIGLLKILGVRVRHGLADGVNGDDVALLVLAGVGMCVAALIALSKQDLRERWRIRAWRRRLRWRWAALLALPHGLVRGGAADRGARVRARRRC